MKNHLLLSILIALFTNSMLQCMDIAYTMPAKSPKSLFLETTLEKINAKKHFNPEKYFSDKQKVANALYALTFLRKCLFTVKRNYDMCKTTEWSKFYNNKHINGCYVPLYNEDINLIPKIKTNLGFLKDYTAEYGDKEYLLILATSAERAFFSKSMTIYHTKNINALMIFLKNQLNSTNDHVKIAANNAMYTQCSKIALLEIGGKIQILDSFFNSLLIQKYFSSLNLKTLFAKESLACKLAIKAFDDSAEAAPSLIEKLQPLCKSSMWDELIQEDLALNQCYRTIINDLQNELYAYSKKNYHTLITQYLSIAPELAKAFSFFGLVGDLPGVTREEPIQPYISPKQNKPLQSGKKKRSRAKTQKSRQTQIAVAPSEKKESNSPNTPTTAIETHTILAPENSILNHNEQKNTENNLETFDVLYDNRVIEQNANKNDLCHGFTLMAIPYIIKNGVHSAWTNRTTNHQDDLTIMYGEIEYEQNNTTTTELVEFQVCKGADNVIYHIGMRKNNSYNASSASYNVEFPPLGTSTIAPKNFVGDDYGSKLLIETDYMIQLWDGGLKATITLYK